MMRGEIIHCVKRTLAGAQMRGASRIIAVDVNPQKKQMAMELGVSVSCRVCDIYSGGACPMLLSGLWVWHRRKLILEWLVWQGAIQMCPKPGSHLGYAAPNLGAFDVCFGLQLDQIWATFGFVLCHNWMFGLCHNRLTFGPNLNDQATDFVNPNDHDAPIQEVLVGMTKWGLDYTFDATGHTEVMRV
jgi:hypothetical protein